MRRRFTNRADGHLFYRKMGDARRQFSLKQGSLRSATRFGPTSVPWTTWDECANAGNTRSGYLLVPLSVTWLGRARSYVASSVAKTSRSSHFSQ